MGLWTIVVQDKHGMNDFGTVVVTDEGDTPDDVFQYKLIKHKELPGVDAGLPHDLFCTELYDQYEVVAAFEGAPTVDIKTGAPLVQDVVDKLSEYDCCLWLSKELGQLGVEALAVCTGGNCWATLVKLSEWDELYLTIADGEGWSWQIDREQEQTMAGYWPGGPDIPRAAKRAKKLIRGFGTIIA